MGENLFSHATGVAKLRIKQTSSLLECFLLRVQIYKQTANNNLLK
jgi:hypothetical protein